MASKNNKKNSNKKKNLEENKKENNEKILKENDKTVDNSKDDATTKKTAQNKKSSENNQTSKTNKENNKTSKSSNSSSQNNKSSNKSKKKNSKNENNEAKNGNDEKVENNKNNSNGNEVKEETKNNKTEKAQNTEKKSTESKKKKKSTDSKEEKKEDSKKENDNEKTVNETKGDSKNKKKSDKKENKNSNEKADKKAEELKKEDKEKKSKLPLDTEKFQKDLMNKSVEKKKSRMYIAIAVLAIIIVVMIFSTIFAIVNLGNANMIKGISIKNIDISGLSKDEAKTLITESLALEISQDINLTYDDFEISFSSDQVEFAYSIDSIIDEAYNIGRNGNIIQNNYSILITTLFGKDFMPEYTYNEEYLVEYVEDVGSKLPGLVVEPSYYIEENELIVEKGTDGIVLDEETLKTNIIDNIVSRNASEISDSSEPQTLEIPVIEKTASAIDMDKIYSEIYTEAQDAYYDTDPFELHPDVDGVDLAISVEEAKEQILAEDKEEYTFELIITSASKTLKDLGTEAFPYQVSTFSTKYDASNTNRSQNLAIAAGKIDGTVLLPGETFSFNKVVGKRTVEEGYKDAKIYVNGGVEDGLAGGICQISSTLYNAVLLANLEIVERRNHSYTTSYVAAGRDATVVYGTIDFQFTNTREYPIKISASVSNGIASFTINGIEQENEYEIKIIPTTTQTIPYSTQYIQDASLASGQQVVVQAGHTGCKVTTYKEIRQNGVLISREVLSNDTYQSMSAIVHIGP